MTITVDPKYHPNIIGKKGAKINKIRESHDVRIQLPERDGSSVADEITIMGYEHQVKAAEADIMKIVQELVCVCVCVCVRARVVCDCTCMCMCMDMHVKWGCSYVAGVCGVFSPHFL